MNASSGIHSKGIQYKSAVVGPLECCRWRQWAREKPTDSGRKPIRQGTGNCPTDRPRFLGLNAACVSRAACQTRAGNQGSLFIVLGGSTQSVVIVTDSKLSGDGDNRGKAVLCPGGHSRIRSRGIPGVLGSTRGRSSSLFNCYCGSAKCRVPPP